MQLWINIQNNNIFENIESILYSNDRKVAKWFGENLPGEVYEELSPQYEIQVMSAMQVKKNLGDNVFKNIKGIYFGTQQCEYLLPTLEETKRAVELLKEFDKKYVSKDIKEFVFVTPYYGNPSIRQRLIENLDYLNENAKGINPKSKKVDIVVNDFGTLKLLQDYENLYPILGNLIVKQLKNPLVDTFGIEENVHLAGEEMKNKSQEYIQQRKKEIADNQKHGYDSSLLDNEYFLNFIKKYNIQRAGLDYQKGYENIYKTDNLNIDINYPYSLIFVGRLCDTSAIENIKRGYYATDEVCPRTCWKYDMFPNNFETVGYKIIQRGNAQYKSQVELELPEDTLDKYDNRLVYTPLI